VPLRNAPVRTTLDSPGQAIAPGFLWLGDDGQSIFSVQVQAFDLTLPDGGYRVDCVEKLD
jgi:hypothetical protein